MVQNKEDSTFEKECLKLITLVLNEKLSEFDANFKEVLRKQSREIEKLQSRVKYLESVCDSTSVEPTDFCNPVLLTEDLKLRPKSLPRKLKLNKWWLTEYDQNMDLESESETELTSSEDEDDANGNLGKFNWFDRKLNVILHLHQKDWNRRTLISNPRKEIQRYFLYELKARVVVKDVRKLSEENMITFVVRLGSEYEVKEVLWKKKELGMNIRGYVMPDKQEERFDVKKNYTKLRGGYGIYNRQMD